MDHIKILVINDEGEDINLEKEIIKKSFGDAPGELEVKYIPAADTKTVEKELPSASGVITVYTEFDENILKKMERCRVIATQTIGVNTIDLDAAADLGICVTNVPDYCVEEVAMHTVTLALSAVRKITTYDKAAREKIWNVEELYKFGQLHRLKGQKYGIVSFGNIGKRVSELMKSFGMEVMAFDPFLSEEVFTEYGVKRAATIEELFESCDIISLHTPLTPKTEGMVDYKLISQMPKGGILINTSRGGIVRENDLAKALEEGVLSAAAVDVITDESAFESPLYKQKNCIITPHVAYYSEEALKECRVKAAEMVGDVLGRHKVPKYLVNKKVIENAEGLLA